ncbi:MAG: type II toxin-antitoxin system PemK/MazF family toxin [Candidatus Aenigmarchaeota archaeon]|nr:type II toxin-antitoxin system PemK/MazF family toxin [Candidatus Aenigmarchaeota archaeon]
MFESGDVVLAQIQFTDTFEVKKRPAVVLFEEFDNVVVAGITSNMSMKGIQLTRKDGAVRDSIIKTNYIFTISEMAIKEKLFQLNKQKREELYNELVKKLSDLRNRHNA